MSTTTEVGVHTVLQLCSFYRGEAAAVECYTTALHSRDLARFAPELRALRQSHRERVRILDHRIRQRGGVVPPGSGPWGTFAHALEGTAAMISSGAALAILHDGEEHGLRDYLIDIEHLPDDERSFVERRLIPAQRKTVRTIAKLARAIQ